MQLGLEAGTDTLDLAVEAGIKGVPIAAEGLVNEGVEKTLAPLQERGLRVCQIGALGYNPLNLDPAQHARLEQAIPLAPETGCPYIVISPGNYHTSTFGGTDPRNFGDQALDEMAAALRPLVKLAEAHGAQLTIEAYLKGAICSVERFLALHEQVGSDALKMNLDVTSLYDFRDMVDPSILIHETCTGLAGHYGLVHIKEVALDEGFHIHAGLAPLGKGATDWAEMLRLAAPHIPDDSWVILEHVLSPEEGRTSLKILRAAATDARVTLE